MPGVYEGKLDAKGLKFAIIVGRFNDFITDRLLGGAMDVLVRHNASEKDIDIIKVPGSFEIPIAAKMAAKKNRYNAIIAVGALIRGATPHFEYIASEVSRGLSQISLEHEIPVAYGMITADTLEQAIERAGTKAGNRGGEAAMSAIEMANLFKSLSKGR
ncbi:MAG: 6,7-dimethyl-8-ribityllumazine synthase [Thermodesulfobacteriota bacterium]